MAEIIRKREPHEPKILLNGDPVLFAKGKIGAIVHYPVLVDQGNGYVEKTFEKFVRPPGTRIIAVRKHAIYLQKEARLEYKGGYDWRLPGGKVFNRFDDFLPYVSEEVPIEDVLSAAKRELHEEASLVAEQMSFVQKIPCGSTVEWDLYYFIAEEVEEVEHKITHDEGEEITEGKWFSFPQIRDMCEMGEIAEGRTVSALLQFMRSK